MSKTFIIVLVAIAVVVLAVGILIKSHQVSGANYYVNNLRQIAAAKDQWALNYSKNTNDFPPRWADLLPFIGGQLTNFCSTNGAVFGSKGEIYTIGRIGKPPSCFVDGQMVYGD